MKRWLILALALWLPAAPVRSALAEGGYTQTRYPIVLVHGLGAVDEKLEVEAGQDAHVFFGLEAEAVILSACPERAGAVVKDAVARR